MKRWNRKGSTHAKVRMAELRARKRDVLKMDLAREYERVAGVSNWWHDAQTLGDLKPGCGVKASISWLRGAIASALGRIA